jgi:hypothetical protein
MILTLLMSLFSIFFDLLAILRISKSEKDLEILILRQQVRILQDKTKTPLRISDPEQMVLATLLDMYCRFKDGARQHRNQVKLIFKPDIVLPPTSRDRPEISCIDSRTRTEPKRSNMEAKYPGRRHP